MCKNVMHHSEKKMLRSPKLSWNEVQAAVPLMIYCTAALTSLSDSSSYITFLFSEWRIGECNSNILSVAVYNYSFAMAHLAVSAELRS